MGPELRELWQTTVPGDHANVFMCDVASGSLFVGDGWGVSYPALRLHRLSLANGEHLADVRTRHQGVSAMAMYQGHLYAATDSRLFELEVPNLEVVRQWDKGLVRYAMQLIAGREVLVAANWRVSTIGIFDVKSGRTRRLRVGLQPLVFHFGEDTRVIAGFDGGMWTIDGRRGRLIDPQDTPPVASLAAGRHIWATLAGPKEGGQGNPRTWVKSGTEVIQRLSGTPWKARASGRVSHLSCDDKRAILWCLLGRQSQRQLEAISQETGAVLGSWMPPSAHGVGFCHVDPAAGVVIRAESHHVTEGNILKSSTSRLFCYALPEFGETRGEKG